MSLLQLCFFSSAFSFFVYAMPPLLAGPLSAVLGGEFLCSLALSLSLAACVQANCISRMS